MPIEEFKNLVITKNIRFIPHHKCAICGCDVGYCLDIDPEYGVIADYRSACDCEGDLDYPVPLEVAANWFNSLPEYKRNAVFVNI